MNLYSVNEVASIVNVPVYKLRVLVAANVIEPFGHVGKKIVFDDAAVEKAKTILDGLHLHQYRTRKTVRFERAKMILEKFEAGTPMAEIGAELGLTRERIRQYLGMLGKSAIDGGKYKQITSRRVALEQQKIVDREKQCPKFFGCSYEVYCQLANTPNVILKGSHKHNNRLMKMFWQHVHNAERPKIPWHISLPDYAKLVTPYLDALPWRGNIVLGRRDKTLPYTIDNVEITTIANNSSATRQQAKSRKTESKARLMKAEGLSVAMIARLLKVSASTVRTYLYREHNAYVDAQIKTAEPAKDQP